MSISDHLSFHHKQSSVRSSLIDLCSLLIEIKYSNDCDVNGQFWKNLFALETKFFFKTFLFAFRLLCISTSDPPYMYVE